MNSSLLAIADYRAVIHFSEVIQSQLDLGAALDDAVPLLCEMVGADHIALAISRPGTMYDYAWHNTTLPEAFLGNYAAFADQDFVRNAVASQPNVVMRDHEMIDRKKLERHIIYLEARRTGVTLEQVMAVMLSHDLDWSSGLALYRTTRNPFDEREAQLLQLLVPILRNAVQNSRLFSEANRRARVASTVSDASLPIIWVNVEGVETGRTVAASSVLECFFPNSGGPLPPELTAPIATAALQDVSPGGRVELVKTRKLNSLHVRYVSTFEADEAEPLWAMLLETRGIPLAMEARLTPRLTEITGLMLRGMSNRDIAEKEDRALATIKQQALAACSALGVSGRKGLMRLAAGF